MKGAPHKTEMETESPGAPASAIPASWVVTASWVGESLVMTPAPRAVVLEKPLPRMPWAVPASTLWSSELILTLST